MADARETNKSTTKEKLYCALILLTVAAIAGMLLLYPRTQPEAAEAFAANAEDTVITREPGRIIEVEKVITAETLREGLADMGVLITQEYYFTDLVSFSSIKKLLKTDIPLPFTESSYLVSYDGAVTAGVDLSNAQVEKDDVEKRITVHIPAAEIQAVEIDLDSFQLLEEKNGLGNRISVQDFNDSLLELENKARRNAVDRGLLEKADENARSVISRFVGSLVDVSAYHLEFVTD